MITGASRSLASQPTQAKTLKGNKSTRAHSANDFGAIAIMDVQRPKRYSTAVCGLAWLQLEQAWSECNHAEVAVQPQYCVLAAWETGRILNRQKPQEAFA